MTDQPSSTKWTSQEDYKLQGSDNSEEEQINISKNVRNPKLCDIILQNLNLKYKQSIKSKSGNYAHYSNSNSYISQKSEMEGHKKSSNRNEELTNINRVSTENDSGLERSTFSGIFSPNSDLRQSRFNKFKSISNVDKNILTLHPVQREEEEQIRNLKSPKKEIDTKITTDHKKDNEENQAQTLKNTKVPNLLNNIKNMYDLNSERVKKRSEQMKKRIVKNKPDEDLTLSPTIQNEFNSLNNNFNFDDKIIENFAEKTKLTNLSRNLLNPTNQREKREISNSTNALKYKKTYQDEENEVNSSPFSDDANKILFKSSDNSFSQPVSLNSYNQTNSENDDMSREPEVVISDLECDIEEDDLYTKTNCIPNSGKNKSFIPLQNHLKKEVQVEKATPSYLMALLGYDTNSNMQSEEDDESNDRNAVLATLNTKHNYDVDEVIEEENSGENNTDSDKSSIKSRKINSRQISEFSNSINSQNLSPLNSNTQENKRTISFNTIKRPQSFNSHIKSNSNISNSCNILLPSINKVIQSRSQNNSLPELIKTNLNLHKNSKSAYTDVRVDMKRVLDGIERRKLSEREERLEKIKLRKNILLNNFCKSNSHHNFPYNFKISSTSNFSNENNEINETPLKKKLSICVDSSNNYGNSYKKLSPSGASRAFYYDYEGEEQNNYKINNDYINFNCDDEEENEEDEDEVIQNRSIIEIKDEDEDDGQILVDEKIKNEEEDFNEYNEMVDCPLIETEVFNFNPTPNDSKINTAEKEKKRKSIFISEDMKISQTGKIDVIQSSKFYKSNSIVTQSVENNTNIDKNNFNLNYNDTIQNKSINFNSHKSNNSGASEKSFKSIKSNYSNKSFKSYTSNNRKPYSSDYSNYKQNESSNNENVFINNLSNNFKFTFSTNLEISKSNLQILSDDHKTKKSQSDIPSGFNKLVYNNNFISNNFNNISINILNSEPKENKDNKNQNKIKFKKKTNSLHTLTQEIKHKIGHNKSNSKTSLFLDEKIRSSSFNKSMSAKKQKSNNFNTFLNFVSPKKTLFSPNKPVLKQYLTYSDTKNNGKREQSNYFTNFTKTNFYENVRVNSDTSVKTILSSSNKHTVIEAMKALKFQISSLDHQKFSLEKLYKSKSKYFCILISTESKENQNSKYSYEFKALYEMNIEKNNLTKVYSINYYPHTIEFGEVKAFYQYDLENENFKLLKFNEMKTFNSDIHAFYMQFNFKKFYKV